MALPRKLLAPQLPLGDDSFEKRTVDLYAASANSQTSYTSGDRLLFQFPSYARSFIDFSKSFIKFDLTVDNGGTTAADGKARVYDSLPIFERMQVRVGAKNIEDVDSYSTLEKIMTQTTRTETERNGMEIFGDYNSEFTDEEVADLQSNTRTYIKKLYSGVLGNSEYLFPIHRLNSGSSLEIELTMASLMNTLMFAVDKTNTSLSNYKISNVKFQVVLLKVSDSFFNKYNQLANNNELILPMTTYRRHVASTAFGQTEPVLFINDNAKNLKRTFTIFRQPRTILRAASTAAGVTPAVIVTQDKHEPRFLKGFKSDVGNQLLKYQFKYMSRNFPEVPAECRSGDGSVFIANLLTNIGVDMGGKLPHIAQTYSNGPIIVQDFTYSEDDFINGLNVNASGSPLILELKFGGVGVSTNVETFSESSMNLVLDQHGNASIVQKTNMNVE